MLLLLVEVGGVWAELCWRAALMSSLSVSSFFCCAETSQRDFFTASEEEKKVWAEPPAGDPHPPTHLERL